MSCIHRTMDPRRERLCLDFKHPHNCYKTIYNAATARSSCYEVHSNRYYSGSYSNRMPLNCSKNNNERCGEGRGDPPFPDTTIQMGRIANARVYETTANRDSTSATAVSTERMQIRLKFLENSNAAMHLKNQNILAENKILVRRLEEDATKLNRLERNLLLLQEELNNGRVMFAELLTKQMSEKNDKICLEDKCISSTNIIPKTDCGIQVWEACKDCQRELEGCQKEPRITITKSELELLEEDMQTLRDAVVAREEAWGKAMEREQNCRHQLARLTAEAITARHFCEARQDELRMVTENLTEKQFELKATQKEMLYLSKLIAKLHRHQKELEEYVGGNVKFNINEKDQRYIEEIAQRARIVKGKSKVKSKLISGKYSHSNSSSRRNSPRDSKKAYSKDHTDSSEELRN